MHAVLLGSVPVIFSLCSARPTKDDTYHNIPLNFTAPAVGTPAEHPSNVVAPINSSRQNGDNYRDLTLPLIPSQYPHLRSVITYDYEDVPKLFLQLPASIAMNIYDTWRDTENVPIRKAFRNRLNPFDNIEFSTIPSMLPGPVLTPVKIGIASFDMLYQMASLRGWPGHVHAKIFETTVEIGTLKVDNRPLVTGSLSVGSNAYNTSSGRSRLQEQQRWLRCFTNVLSTLLVQNLPLGMVTDDPYLSPKQIPWNYRWPCGPGSDEFELRIYPAGNAGSPHELTWEDIFKMMLRWINQVARGEGSQHGYVLQERGVRTAAVTILFGARIGVDDGELDDHTAVTA